MTEFDFYYSQYFNTIIAVYDRTKQPLGAYCCDLSCDGSCGDGCGFEHLEDLKSRFPDAKSISQTDAIEQLTKNRCQYAIDKIRNHDKGQTV